MAPIRTAKAVLHLDVLEEYDPRTQAALSASGFSGVGTPGSSEPATPRSGVGAFSAHGDDDATSTAGTTTIGGGAPGSKSSSSRTPPGGGGARPTATTTGQRRRGYAQIPLDRELLDQRPHKDLVVPVLRPGVPADDALGHMLAAGAAPDADDDWTRDRANLVLHAQFQYSKLVPIKERIRELANEQKDLHKDVTKIQLALDKPATRKWDFPEERVADGDDEAKENDDEETGGGAGRAP
mmetsp:Transcript_6367/g.26765  ORF Transcript_6367/g.26765 Transcript_6367/m.26765 type:complete len:239 (+) Transcript_6367:1182-1898(+)